MIRLLPLYGLMGAGLLAGLFYWQWGVAEKETAILRDRVASMTISLAVAEKQTLQVRAAWAAGQEAIEVLRVRSKELDQIKSDLLKGNYNALDLDPALRDTLCWLLRNRAARGATGSANGSPAAPVVTCNQTRP